MEHTYTVNYTFFFDEDGQVETPCTVVYTVTPKEFDYDETGRFVIDGFISYVSVTDNTGKTYDVDSKIVQDNLYNLEYEVLAEQWSDMI